MISDKFENMNILERFRLMMEYKVGKIQAFAYTYRELVSMVKKGNPLALSALIEGKPLFLSSRVKRLIERAKQNYYRIGRTWHSK